MLEGNGVDVSNLMSDGTQPVKILGPLFDLAETTQIFGESLVFELRGLLIEKRGAEGQFIVIEGWAVEFVPPGTRLVEEALEQAVERDVNGIVTRVFSAEHLAAICLQAGRPKDHDRVIRFVEAGVLDAEVFEAILLRHALMEKWQAFQTTYLDP